jgi:CubicO group peptidase (beta-lactamase class C family)
MKLRPLAGLFTLLLAFPPSSFFAQEGFSPGRLARMQEAITASVDRQEYAGVNVVVARHGQTVFAESFGHRNQEDHQLMQPDTIFWIASMTKPVTAVAVMMLYEEGRFLLEDPVSKYLPAFAEIKVLASEEDPAGQTIPAARAITIRQLLVHTSGLFNFKAYPPANMHAELTLESWVNHAAAAPLAHQPGDAWRYGLSYEILARLVEIWSGQSFDAFLKERIFQPLNMPDTDFYVPADKISRLAKTYRLNAQGIVEPLERKSVPLQTPAFLSGGAGLFSTIGDFQRFAQMLLNGGTLGDQRLLSSATVEYMLQNHVPADVMGPNGPNGRKGFGMGLGGYVLIEPAAYEDLSVKGEFNGAGVDGTFYWIDRQNGLVGLWFAARFPQVQTTLKRFKVQVYQALED